MDETSKQFTRDLNTGFGEGLIITFAIVAGLFGAEQGRSTMIYASLIASIAGALAFAFSRYSTEKTAVHHFQSPESRSLQDQRTKHMFSELGLPLDIRQTALTEMAKDQEQWASNIEPSTARRAWQNRHAFYSSAAIALSYLIAGSITVIPILATENLHWSLRVSAALYTAALMFSGFWRAAFLRRNKFEGAVIRLVIGAAAAACAYFVGTLMG